MMEALQLLTGASTERVTLYVPSAERARRQGLREAKIARRTQLLLQGHPAPEDDEPDEEEDVDITWTRLLSAREAGYLMALGCTAEGVETTREVLLERGLQSPHGYSIMDVREVVVGGTVERLMQLRNPWGERAERTWNGRWGKDSDVWTWELKRELGVVSPGGVKMYDDMSVFWMAFDDVRQNFVCLDICRVHPEWHTARAQGWLPSGVGPGDAFELEVPARTEVDIALWQEKHISRESALGVQSTNVDLGFAVLRVDPSAGDSALQLVDRAARRMEDQVSCEVVLEGGYRYRTVPLTFNQLGVYEPRRVICTVQAKRRVGLVKVP